jgi:hypothetical protein
MASTGELNDRWEFNPSTKQWTWMGGPNTLSQYQSAVYGTQGVFAAGNQPGTIFNSPARWTDKSGHLWLYGTYNGDAELWEFDPSLNQWAWMGGNITCTLPLCTQAPVYGTLGIPAAENTPGPRTTALTWTDNSGEFWVFGGDGNRPDGRVGVLNDLWRLDPATTEWTWMGGTTFVPNGGNPPGVYGALGTAWAGNVPGGRGAAATWTDTQGNLWLFGGKGYGINNEPDYSMFGELNDLWVYQPSSAALPTTATPVISVPSGTYSTIQTVTVNEATHGTVIYYTTDGTEPTTSSALYTSPINVASSQTVKAYAVASGCYNSKTATASYTVSKPTYPAPVISNLSPAFTAAPGAGFTLTVTGTGFTTNSTVYWGSSALPTQALSATQLTAQVPASDVISQGISNIQVQNPTPGGGTSGTLQFEVDSPYAGGVPAPVFSPASVTVAAGSAASYAVTLPSSATSVSAQCLNLPSGATCSYSGSSLAISTSSSTPAGTYQVTVVFTETLPITVNWVLPFFLSPFLLFRKKNGRRWPSLAFLMAISLAACIVGCSAGGGSSIPTQPPTHQVIRSGTVTLVVH